MTRITRRVIEVECCKNRRCFVCAGTNRTVVFSDEVSVGQARVKKEKKKATYERGSCLSEEKRELLLYLLSLSPQHKTDIAILSNLCSRTVENAAAGSKMFNGTRRALELGLELMVQYVRDSAEIHDAVSAEDRSSITRTESRRKKSTKNSEKRSQKEWCNTP